MISHPMFLMRATACAAALLITAPAVASSPSAEAPSWSPKASETLVKLPAAYLKKNLDQDFIDSQLGRALTETETNIELKGKTLSDLKAAIGQARGDDLKMELRHQLLAEKRAFIDGLRNRRCRSICGCSKQGKRRNQGMQPSMPKTCRQ